MWADGRWKGAAGQRVKDGSLLALHRMPPGTGEGSAISAVCGCEEVVEVVEVR